MLNQQPSHGKPATARRHRGGQPGNRNAFRHGNWSAAAIVARKLSVARIKALAKVAQAHGLLTTTDRFRISALRPDQWALLRGHDPELAAVLLAPVSESRPR